MNYLGGWLSNIPFLTGNVFIHRNEKYMILVMNILWRYLKVTVYRIHWVIYLTVHMVFKI